jgi:hypothetical protein
MANNDHIAQLMKGPPSWNAWRDGTPDILHPDLSRANLSAADLFGADLEHAAMVETFLSGADLTGCRIYGISAWNLKLEATKQQNVG